MRLELKRIAKRDDYTIGRLYIDGAYFCDTLEDRVRDLTKEAKVYGKTAIPEGTYEVTLRVQSPRFSQKKQYDFCRGYLPRLLNVPQFEGVLIHCLTPDMEILTENGWQDLASFQSKPASICYSYNMNNGLIEPVAIDKFIEQDYHGNLYSNDGGRVNYSVTDKHRMFVGTKRHDGSYVWGIRTADDIPEATKFLTAAQHEGVAITPQQKTLYRLLMATQADGYILNWSEEASQVRFHFTKDRKIKRVCNLVEQLGRSYKIFTDKEGKTHISLDSELSREIVEYMNPYHYLFNYKELPWNILNLKSEDLKDLLMEYLFFDGRYENYLKNNKNMIICSTNMRTLDLLQAMATLCGMRSYIKNENSRSCFSIVLYEGQDIVCPNAQTYKTEEYHGKVWCLTNKNTTLVVRKNKRPMIIGNCGNTAADTDGCILVGRNTARGMVTQSTETFRRLYERLSLCSGKITIEVK